MMADHDVEEIKLKPIYGGEPNREIGQKRNGKSIHFEYTYRAKKSVQVNLKTRAFGSA